MRTRAKTLGDLLFGQTRGRVLALLYGIPDQTFFVRQIARQIGTSVGSVQRELETLSQFGLIDRSTLGRQVFYQANRNHPVFAELHSLVAKTSGIFHLLRSALAPLAKQISFALVYGSMARGDENAGSDVDLMVIGDVTLDEILAHLTPAERDLGRPINPTVYSLKEFKSKLHRGNHFLNSVTRGKKVFLIGEEDELRKMG
jgi:DNA-binding MarR family transcriptional regulator